MLLGTLHANPFPDLRHLLKILNQKTSLLQSSLETEHDADEAALRALFLREAGKGHVRPTATVENGMNLGRKGDRWYIEGY